MDVPGQGLDHRLVRLIGALPEGPQGNFTAGTAIIARASTTDDAGRCEIWATISKAAQDYLRKPEF